MGSDHGCDCKGSVPAGGGEGERDGVRSRMRLQKDRRHTAWRWSAMGSYHRCDCKGAGTTYHLEVEGAIRSWMRLQWSSDYTHVARQILGLDLHKLHCLKGVSFA